MPIAPEITREELKKLEQAHDLIADVQIALINRNENSNWRELFTVRGQLHTYNWNQKKRLEAQADEARRERYPRGWDPNHDY